MNILHFYLTSALIGSFLLTINGLTCYISTQDQGTFTQTSECPSGYSACYTVAVVVPVTGSTGSYNTFARGCDTSCTSTGSTGTNGLFTGKFCCTTDFCNNQGKPTLLTTINYNRNSSRRLNNGLNSFLAIFVLLLVYF